MKWNEYLNEAQNVMQDAIKRSDIKTINSSFEDMNVAYIGAAAESGQIDVVRYFINKSRDPFLDARNCNTALKCASENGHLNIVKYLAINCLDFEDRLTQSAITKSLDLAIQSNHFDVVKYLVSQGADVTEYNYQPLKIAAKHNRLDMFEYFCDEIVKSHTNVQLAYVKNEIIHDRNLHIFKKAILNQNANNPKEHQEQTELGL